MKKYPVLKKFTDIFNPNEVTNTQFVKYDNLLVLFKKLKQIAFVMCDVNFFSYGICHKLRQRQLRQYTLRLRWLRLTYVYDVISLHP